MKNLGKVFKELRESRNISLRKATGGRFSASLLSRFENGQSEISAQKLITALETIHASMEELLFLARGFHQDAYFEFRNRIFESIDPKDLTSLRTLYQREYQQLCALSTRENINNFLFQRINKNIFSMLF